MIAISLPPTVGLILHFRQQAHTAACLASLLGDGIQRALLVDNSEDGGQSLEALRPTLDELTAKGLEIEICEPGRNLGFSAGINRGLVEIHQRFGRVCVLLINNDARLRLGAHEALRNALVENGGLAVPRMQSGVRAVDSVFYHRATGLLLRKNVPGTFEYLSGCCMLLDPELSGSALFDESFFFYGDDAELGWRLSRVGVSQHKVPDAIVEHDGSIGSRNGSLFYEYHMSRAHWLLARKLSDSHLQYIQYLFGRVIFLPLRAVLRSIRQRSLAPVRGLAMASWDVFHGRNRSLTPSPQSEKIA